MTVGATVTVPEMVLLRIFDPSTFACQMASSQSLVFHQEDPG
jgi:hypothetical protein